MKKLFAGSILVLTCLGLGCRKNAETPSSTSPASSGPVLATVGARTITAGDLDQRLKEQPPQMRMRYSTPEKRRELLDDSIRMELLVQEAHRRGLEKDPEVQRTMDRFLAQRLVKDIFAESQAAQQPSADDVKNYYETHSPEFERPERLRYSLLLLPSPKGDARRPKLKAEAEKLRKEISAKDAKGPTHTALEETVRAKSNDPSLHATGGDLGLRTRAELQQQLGDAATAALALTKVDEMSPVVETDRGVAIFKLTALQPASEESLDASKQRIAIKLGQERRTHALDEFVATLRKNAHVEVDETALAKSTPPASPQMMFQGGPGAPPMMLPGSGGSPPRFVPGMRPTPGTGAPPPTGSAPPPGSSAPAP